MAKEWTDEEVQAEIREAVRIVNEDRERATYAELHSRYGTKPEGEGDEGGGDEGDGKTKPPPAKAPKTKEEKTARKSLWWGEIEDE